MGQLVVSLPVELEMLVRRYAEENGVKISHVVAEALKEYFEKRGLEVGVDG